MLGHLVTNTFTSVKKKQPTYFVKLNTKLSAVAFVKYRV